MTTATKTAGFALLILFLSGVVWAAVYYANKPVIQVVSSINSPQTSSTPLVWANGKPDVDLTAKPSSPQNKVSTAGNSTTTGIFVSADGKTIVDFSHHDRDESGKPMLFNPFIFNGTTTVFENQFSWRLLDGSKNLIAGDQAYAKSPDMGLPGAFEVKGFFDAIPKSTKGVLELYDESPKDGAEIILIRVPVTLPVIDSSGVNRRTFDVYFGNQKKNPNAEDCSKVYPVARMTFDDELDQTVAMNLHALFKGPTKAEKVKGYMTGLPQGVHEPAVEFKNGNLVLNFDDSLQNGIGGSCLVSTIRAQIVETAKTAIKLANPDFAGDVVITVNGSQDQALQP